MYNPGGCERFGYNPEKSAGLYGKKEGRTIMLNITYLLCGE